MTSPPPLPKLEGLCGKSDCEHGLHNLRTKSRAKTSPIRGNCQSCGAAVVDWDSTHARDLSQAKSYIEMLRKEWVGNYFWEEPLDPASLARIGKQPRESMRDLVRHRIRSSVASAKQFRDGMQTPFEGNIIYRAQHATACCCRKCIDLWWGIPRDQDLQDDQIEFLVSMAMLFIDAKWPTD